MLPKAKKENPRLNVSRILNALKVPASTYYRQLSMPEREEDKDFKIIEKHFLRSKCKAGIRQLKMIIERKEGLIFNHKKIARIKRLYGLETKIRRCNKHRLFAKKQQEHEIHPNYLQRAFDVKMPDQVYSIDVTQIQYGRNKAYVAAIKDLCTKEIVANEVSMSAGVLFTNIAVRKAINRLPEEKKKELMIHSDQGINFTHFSYQNILKHNGVLQSMSRRGNCLDNAPIESFFGTFKDLAELKHCKTFAEVKKEVTKTIRYYNYDRPQQGLNKKPPIEYRRQLFL